MVTFRDRTAGQPIWGIGKVEQTEPEMWWLTGEEYVEFENTPNSIHISPNIHDISVVEETTAKEVPLGQIPHIQFNSSRFSNYSPAVFPSSASRLRDRV